MNAALKPLFLGDWERVLFIHYETDADVLQKQIPFALDLWHGSALVSVVAFSMRRFRPAFAGKLFEPFFRLANHEFLNVRTYVRESDKRGIHFLTEWVNSATSLFLGPRLYGLPYRYGKISWHNEHETGRLTGEAAGGFAYEARLPVKTKFEICPAGSVDEFLLERYSAFTCGGGVRRFFDIWHEPWQQCPVEVAVEDGLLRQSGRWFESARRLGANYSPGARDIWMGLPGKLRRSPAFKEEPSQCFATRGVSGKILF
jgi:uncharacterized protein